MRSCPRCFSEYVTDVEFCGLDGERILETETDPLIGKTLDRYEILERLGHGGMSVVYRARHPVIGHEYALKVPYGEIALDRQFAERLRREAQVIAQLDHPNIVRVFDFATTPAGSSFILMELLRGKTLARAIMENGRLKPRSAGPLLHQILLGLSAAHRSGFVHRDLKPGNVMLIGEHGEIAKILDFGLVHVPDHSSAEDTARAKLTETGIAVGTPVYMAPEQMRGEQATTGSDIYSLGAVLFEMLSGLPPYIGSLPDILVKQTQPPPPAPPSEGLENLVRTMLERQPSKRPSAEDLLASLERLQFGSGARAVEVPPTMAVRVRTLPREKEGTTPKLEKRHRFALGAVLCLVLAGGAVWIHDNPPQAEQVDERYEEVVDKASEKLKQVDKRIVTEMAAIGQRLEQKRSKSCSVRGLSNRVSEVIAVIDRAQRQRKLQKNLGLERRARALRKALGDKDINEARCKSLERSVLKIERDLARVTKSERS